VLLFLNSNAISKVKKDYHNFQRHRHCFHSTTVLSFIGLWIQRLRTIVRSPCFVWMALCKCAMTIRKTAVKQTSCSNDLNVTIYSFVCFLHGFHLHTCYQSIEGVSNQRKGFTLRCSHCKYLCTAEKIPSVCRND